MSAQDTLEAITSSRIIAIVREHSADSAKREVDRLISAGVRTIEVSLSTPGALDVTQWISDNLDDGDLHFGVGTVLTDQDVEEAADVGASFIVSPISHAELIQSCKKLDLISVVGALTPTECIDATRLGADLVKLFPAGIWNFGTLKGLLEALPFLKLVPTGGIRISDAPGWIAAGAVAVGMGGGLRSTGSDGTLREEILALAASNRISTL